MRVFKREQLKCCSFDASPQSEWLIMAHLERIWNQHFGVFECHIAAWLGRCTSSSNGHLWNVAVWLPLPSQSAYHGSFRENLESAFWALECHIAACLGKCKSSKRAPLKCWNFDASPQSEWLITAHLERIWNQHFGALGRHITTWWNTCESSNRCGWNVAVLMPLPSKSGLSRLI